MDGTRANLPAELWRWDALDLAAAIRERQISACDAVQASLDRLAAVNPTINAVIDVQAEEALKAADTADAKVKRGKALGPLHGVPVTIKDLADQKGRATVDGVAAFKTRIATEDSPIVTNWRNAGAIIIGRTNTPAFSSRWDTDNAVYGRTWNPWTRTRTPGGSSGGAAAALAVGIGALAHGSDLGGSIRYPAMCCGVAGIRPTQGRVPRHNSTAMGAIPLFANLIAVNGVLARHVRDLRVGLATMSIGDARDPLWVPAPLDGPPPPRPIKVALVTESPGLFVHPAIRDAVLQTGKVLAEAGYAVEQVQPPSIEAASHLRAKLSAADIRNRVMDVFRKLGDPGLVRHVQLFLDVAPRTQDQVDYQDAMAAVMAHRQAWDQFLAQYPLIVGPCSGDLPVEIGFETRDEDTMRHLLAAQALMTTVNLLGLPAVAVPTGTTSAPDAPHGLPLGVQIIAPRFREDLALDAAEIVEARLGIATPIDPVR
ncbi:MAG TPA: amidase [Magnetospirillaceae bacterium]|jgi:amidase